MITNEEKVRIQADEKIDYSERISVDSTRQITSNSYYWGRIKQVLYFSKHKKIVFVTHSYSAAPRLKILDYDKIVNVRDEFAIENVKVIKLKKSISIVTQLDDNRFVATTGHQLHIFDLRRMNRKSTFSIPVRFGEASRAMIRIVQRIDDSTCVFISSNGQYEVVDFEKEKTVCRGTVYSSLDARSCITKNVSCISRTIPGTMYFRTEWKNRERIDTFNFRTGLHKRKFSVGGDDYDSNPCHVTSINTYVHRRTAVEILVICGFETNDNQEFDFGFISFYNILTGKMIHRIVPDYLPSESVIFSNHRCMLIGSFHGMIDFLYISHDSPLVDENLVSVKSVREAPLNSCDVFNHFNNTRNTEPIISTICVLRKERAKDEFELLVGTRDGVIEFVEVSNVDFLGDEFEEMVFRDRSERINFVQSFIFEGDSVHFIRVKNVKVQNPKWGGNDIALPKFLICFL